VKAGSCTDAVVSTVTNDINNLMERELLIFWGVVNDMGKITV